MTESEQQRLFTRLVGEFITWCYTQPGYELTFGETWRPPEMAKINAAKGVGIKNSLHIERLAIDLLLWLNGVLQEDSAVYKTMGDKWKTMHELCRWGGDFKRPDGDHFSMEWHGIQ